MPLALRGPCGFEDQSRDAETELFNKLAGNLNDGFSALDFPDVDRRALSRLVSLGAVERGLDEFGTTTYKLLPVGIRVNCRIEQSVFDVDCTTRVELSDKVGTVGKLGLLRILLADGCRPVSHLEGDDRRCSSVSQSMVSLNMLTRSQLYFEALVKKQSLFEKGLRFVHHHGSHHY